MSNRRPRWPVAVAAATGCFLLAACSSKSTTKPPAPAASAAATQAAPATAATGVPTTPGASGGNPHACSLVTEQEATTALGADPGAGQETPSGPSVSNCVYGGLVGPRIPALRLLERHSGHAEQLPSPAGTCRTIRSEVTSVTQPRESQRAPDLVHQAAT